MQLFVLALVAGLAAATVLPAEQFDEFVAKYNKVYANDAEKQMRFKVFQQTLKRIDELNEGEPFRPHGINQFADLTQEEFAAKYLMDKSFFRDAEPRMSYAPLLKVDAAPGSLPASYDWRDNKTPVVTPVKNQEQCGSCWAFSTTENIESVWALAGNPLAVLAPQQIVDCDTTDAGCNGGNPPTAYEYVIKAGGMELETSYPYVAKDTKCTFQSSKVVAKISGWEYATKTKNETEMQVATLNVSPLSICVDAITWQTYTSGIITKNCAQQLDHCVQIVGWNTQNNVEYWIIRNSWGTSWGNAGFIYVEVGKNLCGLANEATTSKA